MEVALDTLVDGVEELGERGVAEGVALEVAPHPVAERLHADGGNELLEHGRALAVGDAVEVEEGRVGVRHLPGDRVGGDELVLAVGPRLHAGVERHPRRLEAGRLDEREVGHVGGEALVEPEVVPPAHGHEVAEPHVRHLVEDHLGAPEALVLGRRVAEDHALGVGDRADVLHRAEVELGHEDLVVLVEGVRVSEEVGEERQPLLGHLEQLVLIEVRRERAAAVEAERDPVVVVAHDVVRAGDQREQIGREAFGPLEAAAQPPVRQLLARGLAGVRHELPLGGCIDGERVARLEVGLVETGKEAVAVVRLEVGVEVLAAVLGVDELVEAVAGVVVVVLVDDPHRVLGREGVTRQRQPELRLVGLDLRAVDLEALDAAAGVVEEDIAVATISPGEGESDHDVAAVALGAAGEVEVEIVGDVAHALGARDRLLLRQAVAHGDGLGSHRYLSEQRNGGRCRGRRADTEYTERCVTGDALEPSPPALCRYKAG